MTPSETADSLEAQSRAKRTWIRDHGQKRPQHEVDIKKQEALALDQAAQWLRNGIARKNAA